MEPDATEDVEENSLWIPSSGTRIGLSQDGYDQLQSAYDLCSSQVTSSTKQEDNMTKKNFIAIAKHLNFFHNSSEYVFDELVDKMCNYFHCVNLNFDENKFRDVVYTKE